MKKIRLKVISMLVCLAVLAASAPLASAYEAYNEGDELARMEKEALAQEDAVSAYHRIYDYIIYDTKNTVSSYHEEYAGCYIDDDNKLVVCVKNGSTSLLDELKNVINDDPVVKFVYRDWTVAEAISALDEFEAALSENERSRICSTGYSSSKNSVIMAVSAPENIAAYSQNSSQLCEGAVSGYPIIIDVLEPTNLTSDIITEVNDFGETYGIDSVLAGNVIYGGDKIYNMVGSKYALFGTIGVCGTYKRQSCILTAGHVAYNWKENEYNAIYLSTNSTSMLGDTVLYGHEIGDYAAVKIPSSYSMSNTVFVNNYTKTPIYYYESTDQLSLEGRKIFKYGQATGVTSSNIMLTNWWDRNNGVQNLVSVGTSSGLANEGDSGGPVWCVTSKYEYVLVGVLHGDGYYNGNLNVGFSYTPIYIPVNQGFNPWALSPVVID